MELKPGMTYTGNEHCFQGRIKILEVIKETNTLKVGLTLKVDEDNYSTWYEDWNLQHFVWGVESGEYFEKEFPDFP